MSKPTFPIQRLATSAAFLVLFAWTPVLAQTITFGTPASFASGADSHHTVAADFNRDGKLDIAVESFAADTVQVYLNAGGGSFTPLTPFSAGDGPFWLAAGDFNRDGKADLALATWYSGDVRIFLGQGDGSFTAGATLITGLTTAAVLAADLNSDGKLDLAVAVILQDSVKVALGNGDGTFGSLAAYSTGSMPTALAAADFDRDGDLDLAASCEFSDAVTVLSGPGDGTFTNTTSWAAGDGPESLQACDFDRDGLPDLVVSCYNSGVLAFLRGQGDGTFAAPAPFPAVANGGHLIVEDFNADGFLDVALADYAAANTVILAGGEGGTFAVQATLPHKGAPAAGDFNGDARIDLAQASGTTLWVTPNATVLDPSGAFAPARFTPSGAGPYLAAAGDFDRDGIPDVAMAAASVGWVELYRGMGDGTFAHFGTLTVPNPLAVVTADLNRDGKVDLAVASSPVAAPGEEISLFMGQGDGTFTGPTYAALPAEYGFVPMSLLTADLNGDGRADLVVPMENASGGSVGVLLGAGDGSFLEAVGWPGGTTPQGATVGDFDRDGDLDIAVAHYGANAVEVLWNRGDGWFDNFHIYLMTISGPTAVTAGDFDGDGDLDLAASEMVGNRVSIMQNDGAGTFTMLAGYFDVSGDPRDVEACDVDRDGRLDLPTCDWSGGRVVLGRNLGGLTFDATYTCGAGTQPFSLLTGDFNRDGKVDLVAPDSGGARMAVLLNDTCVSPPTEARDVMLAGSGATQISWQPPATPGTTRVRYDLLRSTDPTDFAGATVVARYTALPAAHDATEPAPLLCYIVRAENGCGSSP